MVTRALAAIEMASSSCVRIITDTLLPRSETDFNIRRQRAQSFAGNAQRASASTLSPAPRPPIGSPHGEGPARRTSDMTGLRRASGVSPGQPSPRQSVNLDARPGPATGPPQSARTIFSAHPNEPRTRVKATLFRLQIHRADLFPEKVIGSGQYGDVYRATQAVLREDGTMVRIPRAVKILKDAATPQDKDEFVHEAEVMLILRHHNLVQMVGVALQQRPWLSVLELCAYGDMSKLLQTSCATGRRLTLLEQLEVMRQVGLGMEFMASKDFVHMDLAARNVLIHTNNVIKISDFGLARKLDAETGVYRLDKPLKLPIPWMAFESLQLKVFSIATDIWAFGVLMWEIFAYGLRPYSGVPLTDIASQLESGMRLQCPSGVDVGVFEDVVKPCWYLEPSRRPPFTNLVHRIQAQCRRLAPTLPPIRDIGLAIVGDTRRQSIAASITVPGNATPGGSGRSPSQVRPSTAGPARRQSADARPLGHSPRNPRRESSEPRDEGTGRRSLPARPTTAPEQPRGGSGSGRFSPEDVGKRVMVKGYGKGTIRYIGPLQGRQNPRVGVALDAPNGVHDGFLEGVQYFKCDPLHGVFASEHVVFFYNPNFGPDLDFSRLDFNGFGLADIGTEVVVGGFGKGTLRFVGLHDNDGRERLGIELDQPVGKNDGTVRGYKYFTCEAQFGLLCGPEKVVRFAGLAKDNPAARRATVTTNRRPNSASANPPQMQRVSNPPMIAPAEHTPAQLEILQKLREMFRKLPPADLAAIAKSAGSLDHAVELALAVKRDDVDATPEPAPLPIADTMRLTGGGESSSDTPPPLPTKRYSSQVAQEVLASGRHQNMSVATTSPPEPLITQSPLTDVGISDASTSDGRKERTKSRKKNRKKSESAEFDGKGELPLELRPAESPHTQPHDGMDASADQPNSLENDDLDAAAEARRNRPAWRRAIHKVNKRMSVKPKKSKDKSAKDKFLDGDKRPSEEVPSDRNPYGAHPDELIASPNFEIDDGSEPSVTTSSQPRLQHPTPNSGHHDNPSPPRWSDDRPSQYIGSPTSVHTTSSTDVDTFLAMAAEFAEDEDEVDC